MFSKDSEGDKSRGFDLFGRLFFFFGNGNDLCALMLLMSWIMTYLSHLFEFEVKKKMSQYMVRY